MSRSTLKRAAAAVVVMVMLALTGCSPTLPTDGPVGRAEAPPPEDYDYAREPVPPQPGDAPEDIIRGFMQAGAGPQNDYEVARQYLTEEAAQQWSADARTFVYASDPTIQPAEGEAFSVDIEVDRYVDGNGSMSRPGGVETFHFEVEEVDGEWRISDAPEGKILDTGTFDEVFTDYTLYFYDTQERYAVPDVRWFISRQGLAAEIANRILQGPAPWLEEGVVSAFGPGATMGSPSVPVSELTATVDLDAAAIAGASDRDLALMRHQLNLALSQLSTVRETELTVNGSPLQVPEPGDLPEDEQLDIETQPRAGESQIGVRDGTLVRQTGRATSSITGLPDISDLDPRFPAVPSSPPEPVFAFMDGDLTSLYHVRPDTEEPELLVEAERLTRPSMDNFGWTWTVAHDDGEPTIRAFSYEADSEPARAEITADFLGGREVTSLRISQDGTRAALVVEDAGVRTLFIASVVRDGSTGVPRGLGGHYILNADVPVEEVRWAENDAVMVWEPWDPDEEEAPAPAEVQRINLSGTLSEEEEAVSGLLNVSVGEGQSNIYMEQAGDRVYSRVGEGWQAEDEIDVRDLSYPG
ncbi:LpqB family beta-propeller domain-containing protein [Nesterenkonia sp.]|uniref:LpqB family beta-propeller domain-containing protein n=1 Tax=Nesterenkonia sp. TaxID=704201 RepID=UPI002612F941|nr:LpqB family beta-propeller domain-containing protein [Nesterenkonia sp.]